MTTITARDLFALPVLTINEYDTTAWDGGHQQDWLPSRSKAALTGERAFDGVIPVRVVQTEYPRFTGYIDAGEIARHMSTTGRSKPLNLRPRRRGLVWRFVGWIGGGR